VESISAKQGFVRPAFVFPDATSVLAPEPLPKPMTLHPLTPDDPAKAVTQKSG
jgi:hypothetical protein